MKIKWKLLLLFTVLLVAFAVGVVVILNALGVDSWWAGITIGIVFGIFYPSKLSWVEFT